MMSELERLYAEMLAGKHDDWSVLPKYTPREWGNWSSFNAVWSADSTHAIVGSDTYELKIVPLYEALAYIHWDKGMPPDLLYEVLEDNGCRPEVRPMCSHCDNMATAQFNGSPYCDACCPNFNSDNPDDELEFY